MMKMTKLTEVEADSFSFPAKKTLLIFRLALKIAASKLVDKGIGTLQELELQIVEEAQALLDQYEKDKGASTMMRDFRTVYQSGFLDIDLDININLPFAEMPEEKEKVLEEKTLPIAEEN